MLMLCSSTIFPDEYRQSLGERFTDEAFQPVRQLLSKPPATWNELLEQNKYLTKRNGATLTRSSIALGTADNVPYSEDILMAMMLQNGAKVVSSDRRNALFHTYETTPAGSKVRPGEKALEFYTSFANPAKDNYSWNPSQPSALDAFGQGKVAMVIAYTPFIDELKAKYPNLNYERTALPQISLSQPAVNFIKFKVETVTQTADNASAAFAMLRYYANSSSSSALASEQRLRPPFLKELQTRAEEDAFSKMILTGQSVFKRNRVQFDATFRKMIVDATQNGVPINLSLDAGAETINQLLNPDSE
jgi:ABC-type glycerol-3-phosphate transport system substrate-binding protein